MECNDSNFKNESTSESKKTLKTRHEQDDHRSIISHPPQCVPSHLIKKLLSRKSEFLKPSLPPKTATKKKKVSTPSPMGSKNNENCQYIDEIAIFQSYLNKNIVYAQFLEDWRSDQNLMLSSNAVSSPLVLPSPLTNVCCKRNVPLELLSLKEHVTVGSNSATTPSHCRCWYQPRKRPRKTKTFHNKKDFDSAMAGKESESPAQTITGEESSNTSAIKHDLLSLRLLRLREIQILRKLYSKK